MNNENVLNLYQKTVIAYKKLAINYKYNYPNTSVILMFFSFAATGWLWEVIWHWLNHGSVINRGMLHGPWLPIYGVGGVLMLLLLKKFRESPLQIFSLSVLVCGIVEYFASWLIEQLFDARWWNYSNKMFNINGRIYLAGLLFFGVGGCLITYFGAPLIHQKLLRFTKRRKIVICTILLVLFLIDVVVSLISPNMGTGISSVIK